jgi:hypothetical protein
VAPLPTRANSDPQRAIAAYLAKVGGLPVEGEGSDCAVHRAAVWAKHNAAGLDERAFVDAVRGVRPEFHERWIVAKWRSAVR